MALIHRAELFPSKHELLSTWLAGSPWKSEVDNVDILGAFRFDDPKGVVGIETFLVSNDRRVLQVPVTYRGQPLDGAESFLIATMEHSVLGRRWAYDATADPVYATALTLAILTGGTQAALEFDYQAPPEKLKVTTRAKGSGSAEAAPPSFESVSTSHGGTATTIIAGTHLLEVIRVVDTNCSAAPQPFLSGTWPGQPTPAVLATVQRA